MDNEKEKKGWIKWLNGIVLIFTIFMIWLVGKEVEPLVTGEEGYKQFKADTTIIEGQVNERHIQNDNSQKERYLLVTYNDDSSKLVNVNEKYFNAYDKGSKVKFRIDRTKDNEVVVDLKKHKDINSKEAYKQYKNNDENGIRLK